MRRCKKYNCHSGFATKRTGGSSSGMKDGGWLKPCFKESSLLPEGETLQRNCWSFGGGHIVGEINFYFRLVLAHHSCGEHAQAGKKKNFLLSSLHYSWCTSNTTCNTGQTVSRLQRTEEGLKTHERTLPDGQQHKEGYLWRNTSMKSLAAAPYRRYRWRGFQIFKKFFLFPVQSGTFDNRPKAQVGGCGPLTLWCCS